MKRFRVVVTAKSFGTVDPTPIHQLEENGAEIVLVRPSAPLGEREMQALLVDADAAIVGADAVTEVVLDAAPRLRIVAMHGVGTDRIDVAAASRRGIFVTSAPGSNSTAVAELTIALILALARSVVQAHQATASGSWVRFTGVEVSGKRLGLVGLGQIGRAVAVRALALGMKVSAYDPFIDTEFCCRHSISGCTLEEVISKADFVSLHVPLTPETAGLFGPERLDLMKPGAFLINTSRGKIVDEAALADRLKAGRLAGAALDVFEQEPPVDSPLLGLSNVVLTPHMGAHTREAIARMSRMSAESVLEVMAGRVPTLALNPEVAKRV